MNKNNAEMHEGMTIEQADKIIQEKNAIAMEEIYNTFEDCKNNKLKNKFKIRMFSGVGAYKNHSWLELTENMPNGKKYYIATPFCDVDPKTGNRHVIFGKVQFSTSNQNIQDAETGKWYYCPSETYPSFTTKSKAVDIEDENVGIKAVATFLTWYDHIKVSEKNSDESNLEVNIQFALNAIQKIQKDALVKIKELLDVDKRIKQKFSLIEMKRGHFLNYRNYIWIELTEKGTDKVTCEKYFISMFMNDVNSETGNPHTIFNIVQFSVSGQYEEDNKTNKWLFHPEKTYPTYHSKNRVIKADEMIKAREALNIENEDIAENVVEAFLAWHGKLNN